MFKALFNLILINVMPAVKYATRIGVKVGKGCQLSRHIGWPSEAYLIEIGDYVRIAKGSSFYTHGGVIPLRKLKNDPDLDHFGKIKIGSYTSLGENVMVMAGVEIGERCIVGGGSVVTKSIPDGCMVAGNPAKFIGFTEDFYKRLKDKYDVKSGRMSFDDKRKYLLSLPDEKFEHKKMMEPVRK